VAEAFRSWVIPAVSIAVAGAVVVLSAAGLVSGAVAVSGATGALLVLVIFSTLRPYLFSEERRSRSTAAAFAAFWGVAVFLAVWTHDFPGRPLAGGRLRATEGEIHLPPASRYAIVVDGQFRPAEGVQDRTGAYRLELVSATGENVAIQGLFRDRWMRQRLGRRGSAPVEVRRTSQRHSVSLPREAEARLRLASIDASLEPELSVEVYRDLPAWWFPLVGIAGVAFSLAWEKACGGDGTVAMAFLFTYAAAFAYLRWGSPHPDLRSFVGAVLSGGVMGVPASMVLWRLVPARWFSRLARAA
jgi:hypothetical protein